MMPATRIALTSLGAERFAAASRHHQGVGRRIFTSRLSEAEAQTVIDVLGRLQEALRG